MAVLYFSNAVIEDVAAGKINETIIPVPYDGGAPIAGESMFLFLGERGTRKVECKSTQEIKTIGRNFCYNIGTIVYVPPLDILNIANNNGFGSSEQLGEYLTKTYSDPFQGLIIRW